MGAVHLGLKPNMHTCGHNPTPSTTTTSYYLTSLYLHSTLASYRFHGLMTSSEVTNRGNQQFGAMLMILGGVLVFLFLSLLVYVIRELVYERTATAPSSDLPRRFSHRALRRATSSFSDENRLGKGGVGSVFGGVLADGRGVAVKVMDSGSLQGEREFRNEVLLARRIGESERVLTILGFAGERKGKELVLVYELMRNGSLQDALLYRKCVELNEWKVRFGIALDVAQGICFLHFVCDPPVIHCDIKASNVLLDCGFRAKLADFGLAFVKCGDGGYCQPVDMVEGMRCGIKRSDEKMDLGRCVLQDSLCRDVDLEMSLEKQGSGVGAEFGVVKKFPMEWVGGEVEIMRRTGSEVVDALSDRGGNEGYGSYDDEVRIHINEKHKRLPREWWKEEFSAELTNKSLKKRGLEEASGGKKGEYLCWQGDNEGLSAAKGTRKSMAVIDWCNNKLSLDIFKKQGNSHDWACGDPPKSHCVTSTPSMKGTVCYTAPEFSCAGQLSEKCDIYSFGVLLLVLISGRRPLEMTSSPMKDFERANLVTWARQLALDDRLLDLVDPNIKSLDKEQAMRCLTIALLCLQRSPAKRPSAKEIVQMLSNSSNPPHFPPLRSSLSPPLELHLQAS